MANGEQGQILKNVRRVNFLIAARLIVRYMMKDSNMSKTSKRAIEDLAAVMVAGILGMIMLSVLGKMK